MTSFDLTSPIVRELRAARPVAPAALRSRVLEAARREPEARFSLPPWPTVRRAALVAVPGCLAIGVGAAVIGGIVSSGGSGTATRSPVVLEHPPTLAAAPRQVFGAQNARSQKQTFSSGSQLRALGKPQPRVADSAAPGAARLAPSTT